MKKTRLLFLSLVVTLILLAIPLFGAQALDKLPPPLDPQSWILQRDMTWEDYHPNPVIDWMVEQNLAGLQRPSTVQNNTAKTPIIGGLVMIEYLDRKFISRQPQNSDPTGFYMYKTDGTGMEDQVTRNPVISGAQIIADEKYNGDITKVTDAEFARWWADYLNTPQAVNNYSTIDEYYREASYGKWQVDLRPYGPFTIPYFEFETMGYDQSSSFQTYRDVPPSFRRGAAGTTNMWSFDTVAIPFARDSGVPFRDMDFFFMLHAGYDESGVWQQLGMAQFANRAAVPYELGPGPRMLEVEKFFTENPSWLTTYATRYAGSNPGASFWAAERDRYAAMVTAGTAANYVFKLPQTDWDWVNGYNDITQRNTRYVAFTCWQAAVGEWSHMSNASSANTGAGRTIPYSTQGENDGMGTFAHEFGHIGGWPDNYQLQWTINNSPLTEPWEIMSRGQLGGPFDYHTRWQVPNVQGGTVPTNPTMRNKIVARFYDAATANPSNTIPANGAKHNDILEIRVQDLAATTPVVTEVVARNIPLNNNGLYPQLDKYGLYGPNFYKGIHLTFATGTTSAYRDRATRVQTGWTWTYTAQATWMGVEVVDMNGYDSFAPDHGVILTRHANESSGTGQSYTWNVIDSHLYDISMVDYMVPGQNGAPDDYVAHALGSPYQLWDSAFHAGKSFVDTGYYMSEYDPADPHYNEPTARKLNTSNYDVEWKKAMLKPGSIQRWEPQNGRKIASGDTVNEWHDPFNDLHFYILAKTSHDGRTLPGKTEPEQFLSYTIGVRHGAGTPVGGALDVEVAGIEAEKPGRVAVASFDITNTGDATDIIRVGVDGVLEEYLLNDLYAVDAGETITVPVYFEIPAKIAAADVAGQTITFTASSESNKAKVGVATVAAEDLLIYNLNLYMTTARTSVYTNETLLVDVMLKGDVNYTQVAATFAYDSTLLEYTGYDNLKAVAAEIKKDGADKISLRVVSSINMLQGVSCATPARIVTLKFTIKKSFEGSVDTALTIPAAILTPTASAGLAVLTNAKALPLTLNRLPGNEFLEANLEIFPDMFDYEKGQTKPYFSNAADRVICEEVWIEVPCDIDGDGKRDLIRARFRRPIETRTMGLKTPVIAELTPYSSTFATQCGPFGGKVDTDFPGVNNPDTTDLTYDDIRYDGPKYKDLLDPFTGKIKPAGLLAAYGIPDARVPVSSQREGAPTAAWNPQGWHAYFIPLGYTCAHLTIVGSNYGEGFLTFGDYNESLCSAALVDWLNGRVKGYTNPTNLIEVLPPYWATGEIAMSGTSYNGTLPIAGAATGVEGLRTVIPFAPVSSSYEYYRSNGSVYAPGDCQAEDVSDIIGYCFGRGWAGSGGVPSSPVFSTFNSNAFDPPKTMFERFYEYMAWAYEAQDRTSGDYSAFWDARNQVSFGDDMRKDLGIIMFHGFNDNNVKFKSTALINDMADRYGITAKGIFHQGMHSSPHNQNGLNFYPNVHKWFDYYLFGVENGMPEAFPDYYVQSNVDVTWTEYDRWPMGDYQKFYPNGAGRVGSLALTPQTTPVELPFKDAFVLGLTRPNQTIPTGPAWDPLYASNVIKYAGHPTQMASGQTARWKNYMLGGGDRTNGWTNNWTAPASGVTYDLTQELGDRLLYVVDIPEDITISGTIKMTAQVAADKNVGYISAFLVDFGSERRYGSGTGTTGSVIAPNGTSVNLVSYNRDANATPARLIARGSVDVQNPNYDGKLWLDCRDQNWTPDYYFQTTAITPGKFYPYSWEMNVMEYTVLAGHKLALIIFGTDPEYTQRPYNATGFTVEIGPGTYLSLPLVKPYVAPAVAPAMAVLEAEEDVIELIEEVVIEELEEDIVILEEEIIE